MSVLTGAQDAVIRPEEAVQMMVVTGAPGHLGNNLVRKLLSRGEKVRALVLKGESLASLEGLDVRCAERGGILPARRRKTPRLHFVHPRLGGASSWDGA